MTRAVGAANTLRRSGHAWEATNTDVQGFLDPLDAVYPASLQGARAAVMGAGGAARAVAVALVSRGARVTIHARRREQAADVAAGVGADLGGWPPPAGSWDLLVNCTPLGGGPFDGRLVYDLTYGDSETALLRDARKAGCLAIDGLPMLIAQAERQFDWWTGQEARAGVMKTAISKRMAIDEPVFAGRPGPFGPGGR